MGRKRGLRANADVRLDSKQVLEQTAHCPEGVGHKQANMVVPGQLGLGLYPGSDGFEDEGAESAPPIGVTIRS